MPADTPPPFVAYGIAHTGALVLTAAASAALAALVRTRPGTGLLVRALLFVSIAAVLAFELSIAAREGWLTWRTLLPLHLCDAAMVLALVTLVWPRRAAAELLYFWAGAGSSLALLTPDLPWGFPRWEFVVFFGLHGLVLVTALLLVFGLGLRPRRGGAWRAFGATLLLAGAAGAVNVRLGTNFMFLRSKPAAPPLSTGWAPGPST